LVGRDRDRFSIGWKTGGESLAAALADLGIFVDRTTLAELLPSVRRAARSLRRSLTSSELLEITRVCLPSKPLAASRPMEDKWLGCTS
jgi:hypothetical protein